MYSLQCELYCARDSQTCGARYASFKTKLDNSAGLHVKTSYSFREYITTVLIIIVSYIISLTHTRTIAFTQLSKRMMFCIHLLYLL